MLTKLNKEAPPEVLKGECDCTLETSDNNEQQDITLLKERVANYKKVMTQDFCIPPDFLFRSLPLNIGHLLSFVAKNWKDLAGVRLYLAKKSVDPGEFDYEILFVPCREKLDENGESSHYEDMLGLDPEEDRCVIYSLCRRPPGCEFGAGLL